MIIVTNTINFFIWLIDIKFVRNINYDIFVIRRVWRYQTVYRRRTDNTMANRSTKGQTTIYKTYTYN